MPLSNALYRSQDQSEQDLTQGPGWTIDDQKPSFFANSAEAIPRGIGQGAADGVSILAHGIENTPEMSMARSVLTGNPLSMIGDAITAKVAPKSTAAVNDELQSASDAARDFSKTLTPDPRVTGTGANLIQGFAKAVTEFSAGTIAGPAGGAALLGAAEGYGHYNDLRDQGVDDVTATKSGLLTALTSGGGAVLPLGMPAKWLAGLSVPATLLAQAGAGAVINTSFGAASRYAGAKILDDAGYHEMAEQMKPWDETNVITDALSGLFFGAHAGWHGLNAGDVDPAIRDAAKVVQDRQEVMERAPGVPVDMKSAAVHRASLETALGDLMNDKPVDLSHVDTEGATFARPDIDETPTADIIREEFTKAGVLDSAADFDRWLAGEKPREPKEVSIEPPEKPVQVAKDEHPDVDTVNKLARESQGEVVSEQTPSQVSPRALEDRPDLQIVDEHGEARSAADEQQKATEAEAQANKEAEPMHKAAVDCEARFA